MLEQLSVSDSIIHIFFFSFFLGGGVGGGGDLNLLDRCKYKIYNMISV